MSRLLLVAVIVLLAQFTVHTHALQQTFDIVNDNMVELFLTNFGFEQGGVLNLTVKNWKYNLQPWNPNEHDRNLDAFLIRITKEDTHSLLDKVERERSEDYRCFLLQTDYFGQQNDFIVIKIQNPSLTQFDLKIGGDHLTGFYNIFHMNCLNSSVSFQLELNMYNIDKFGNPIFVSAGKDQLPFIYAFFASFYFLLLIIWVFVYIRSINWNVKRTHGVILAVICSNLLALLFASISEHYSLQMNKIFTTGIIFFDIFSLLSTALFFVLIAIIGNSFINNEKEIKKVFGALTTVEVIVSFVGLVIGEVSLASKTYLVIEYLLKAIDYIICTLMIVYFGRVLRELKKAFDRDSLLPQKFQLFKQFFKIIVVYIVLTRVVLFFISAILSSNLVWFEIFCREMMKFIFYCTLAYRFNPSDTSPYVNLPTTDDDHSIKMQELDNAATHTIALSVNVSEPTKPVSSEPTTILPIETTHTL